jgi:hypothetical protein
MASEDLSREGGPENLGPDPSLDSVRAKLHACRWKKPWMAQFKVRQ